MNKKIKWLRVFGVILVISLLVGGAIAIKVAKAESNGSGLESGVTSHIESLYMTLQGLGFGSDTNSPDWGAKWNRIVTAAEWTLSGNAATGDVKNGKTFYNTTRGQQTGTYQNPSSCSYLTNSDNIHHDSYGDGEPHSCDISWTTNSSPVTGDDNLSGRGGYDPRTGVTWSQDLINNYVFTISSSTVTAGATYTNNGATFVVLTSITNGTTLSTSTVGNGGPLASGTLTKSGGTGTTPITFSAVTNSVAFNYLSGTVTATPWTWDGSTTFTVTSATAYAGDVYQDTNTLKNFTVVTTINPGTSLNTTGNGPPSASGTLSWQSGNTGSTKTITFSAVVGGNNAANSDVTAKNLCANMNGGGVWRLPTQKELMQAYIDGSYFNLTQVSNYFWSATEYSSASAWYVSLYTGNTSFITKSTSNYQVRCVR